MNILTTRLLLMSFLLIPLHAMAQDSAPNWNPDMAVKELRTIVMTLPDGKTSAQDRKDNAANWAKRIRDENIDLDEDECLIAVAEYLGGKRAEAGETMYGYIIERGELPESMNDYRGFVERMLPPRINLAITEGKWAEIDRVLPVLSEWTNDPYPLLTSIAGVLRANGEAGRTSLLTCVSLMVDDPRINAEEKEAFLERIYGMKPVPAKKPVDRKEARAVGDAAPRIGPAPLPNAKGKAVPFKPFAGPSLDGTEISTLDFAADKKVLLIDFWATWCGPCIREMPSIVKMREKYGDQGLAILGVSLDNPNAVEKIKATMKRLNMDWPQIYDGKGWKTAPARLNNVGSIPRTILLDRDGVARFSGLRGEALEPAIRSLLELEDAEVEKPEAEAAEPGSYQALAEELGVSERANLLMWRSTQEGIDKLARFQEEHPDTEHLEEVMYLQAIGHWNLYRYEQAADAYATYLAMWPDEKRASLAMTRHVQSLHRSDQPEAALLAVEKYEQETSAAARELHAADAMALAGRPEEARALLKTWMDMINLPNNSKRMREMARAQYERLGWIGKPLKAFEVPEHGSDETLTPESFQGDVLLIDFWASWCRPCMAQMPELRALYTEHHDQGLEIFGISLDEDQARMDTAREKSGIEWPVFNDGRKWKNELAVLFDIHRIPTMILVDRKGEVRYVDPPAAALPRLINELLNEQ